MKLFRFIHIAIIAIAVYAGSSSHASASLLEQLSARMSHQEAYREKIRAMHILDRPDRIGHFYGNTVRRLHRWQHCR